MFSKSAKPLDLQQRSTIRALFKAKSVDPTFVKTTYILQLKITLLHSLTGKTVTSFLRTWNSFDEIKKEYRWILRVKMKHVLFNIFDSFYNLQATECLSCLYPHYRAQYYTSHAKSCVRLSRAQHPVSGTIYLLFQWHEATKIISSPPSGVPSGVPSGWDASSLD